MSSRIEQIIEEIEEYVDSCKFQPLSTTKIVVNKEELEELLRELRLKTPDEIKRYQKIISNKDAILADAQSKADGIIASAEARAREMVSQHEVMQQAYAQANDTINKANQQAQQILDSATQDANNIRYSAITYTDDMLANLGNLLGTTIDDVGARYNALVQSLQSAYSTVKQNRQELAPQTGQGEYSDSDTDSSRDNNQYDLGDDDLGDIDELSSDHIDKASGSCDYDLGILLDPLGLETHALASDKSCDPESLDVLGKSLKLCRDLKRQLSCRTEDQCLDELRIQVKVLQYRYAESKRLTCSGRCFGNDADVVHHEGNSLLLNGRRPFYAHLLQRIHYLR